MLASVKSGVKSAFANAVRRFAPTPPRAAAASLGSSSMMPGYEGAQRNRRLFAFRPTEAAVNSLLVLAGGTLRARARHLVRNNPYAKKAQRVFVSKLIGNGIVPIPVPPAIDVTIDGEKVPLKQAITVLWGDWVDEADVNGLTDFYGLQAMVARALFDAGECFLRFKPQDSSAGLSVPLQIDLLESEFCPYELNLIGGTGNPIRAGVEFDKDSNKRVAYWFWRHHPGEIAIPFTEVGYVRVPAEEVLHVFEPIRPGQIRGVSWLAAAIVRAYLLDQYEDAELERKKVAALFAGFITKQRADDASPLDAQDQPTAGDSGASLNAPGEAIAGLTPGMLQVLLEGESITFSNPADVGPNFEAFEYRAVLALCAAMDIPYFAATGDLKQANYSSLRMGLVDMKESIEQIRHTVMAFQLCRGVYRRWLTDAVLAGALPIKAADFRRKARAYLRVNWMPPKWTWVDPFKEVQADRLSVRSGFTSRESIIASSGEDLDTVDQASARSNASADKYGLVLDSDPRRTDARGSAPPPDTTPPQETPAAEEDSAEGSPDENATDEEAA